MMMYDSIIIIFASNAGFLICKKELPLSEAPDFRSII